jgi:hypothetical protein
MNPPLRTGSIDIQTIAIAIPDNLAQEVSSYCGAHGGLRRDKRTGRLMASPASLTSRDPFAPLLFCCLTTGGMTIQYAVTKIQRS